jgi:predicted permease
MALRAALGAGRRRLIRQLLTESTVAGILAGGIGVGLAFLLLPGLLALAPDSLPRLDEVAIDGTALVFALGLSLVATLAFGLVPAVHAARLDLADLLKQGGARGATSGGGSRTRAALVVAEVALSVALLSTAALLLRSLEKLQGVDLGFTTDRVLVAYTEYAVGDEAEIRARSAFYADLLERLRSVPGVRAASGTAFLPMGREPRPAREYFIEGQPPGQPGSRPQAELYPVTPEYFATMEIPLRAGRDFGRADTWEQPRVAIVNEALGRAAFGGASPLGRQIRTNDASPWMEIVGIVADTRWQDPSLPPPPAVYVSSLQGWGKSLSILVRSSQDQASLATTVRALLQEANASVPVRFETMGELFGSALAYPRFRTRLIGTFAAAAALLAGIGIFSVLAYLVGQRGREIAVRRAVGAGTADVIRLIAGQGGRLVGMGLAVGLAGALASARLLQRFLYEISPWDLVAYLGALGVIGMAAVLATLVPAIRAAGIAPLKALQEE